MIRDKLISVRVNARLYEKVVQQLEKDRKKYVFKDGSCFYEGSISIFGRTYHGCVSISDILEAALLIYTGGM